MRNDNNKVTQKLREQAAIIEGFGEFDNAVVSRMLYDAARDLDRFHSVMMAQRKEINDLDALVGELLEQIPGRSCKSGQCGVRHVK